MIVNNLSPVAQVQGVSSNSFGFKSSAKMFDLLINKMYTNKQGAVIRELSANAWDSHVESGNYDVPFDLHLPTWLDKTFHIRDYGTGIPHDEFEEIYTNIGASTKEGTNDYIGSFGLGSKVSFTMTDTFMVENHYNGIKTTWICFKDKGEPQVSKVADEETSEPSGLKVSFSFDEGDVPEFTKQVSRQLKFFPVKPNITGGEGNIVFPELPDGWETQDYFYSSQDRYNSDNYVVMGNVAYKLDSSEFDYSMRPLFNKGLTIKAPIGAVDIPPSREHLEMTPRTKNYIIAALQKIKQEYSKDVQAKIDTCKTTWELRKVVFDINTSILDKKKDLMYKGAPVDWGLVRGNLVSSVSGYSIKTLQSRYVNPYRKGYAHVRSIIDGSLKYYVNDLGVGGGKLLKQESAGQDTTSMIVFHVDGVTDKTRDTLVPKAIKEIEAEIGEKPLLLSSVFGFPVKAVRSKVPSGKSEPNQVFQIAGLPREYDSLKSQLVEQSDLPTDGYYVELKLWAIISTISRIRSMLEYGLTEFLDKPLYAVRSKTIKKLGKGMIPLSETIVKGLSKDIKEEHEKREYIKHRCGSMHLINEYHKPLLKVLKNKRLRAYARYSAYVTKKRFNFEGDTGSLYMLINGATLDYKPELPKKIQTLREQYEPIADILSSLCNSYSHDRNEKRVKALANFITDNQ